MKKMYHTFKRHKKLFLLSILIGISLFSICETLLLLYIQAKDTDEKHENVKADNSLELLHTPWQIIGSKTLSIAKTPIPANALQNKDTLRLTYNLHGLCLLGGIASSITFEDTRGIDHSTSLERYGKNCFDGVQQASIPLNQLSNYIPNTQIKYFYISIWYPTQYSIDIFSAVVYNAGSQHTTSPMVSQIPVSTSSAVLTPTVTISQTPLATISLSPATQSAFHQTWPIQSVSSMKETKDKVCHPDAQAFIEQWVDTAKNLGVNYIAVETPYDNPSCGNAVAYTRLWVSVIRSRGLHVWHRHAPLAFEGNYSVLKNSNGDYLTQIANYIKANPDIFQPGDIFTPIPEPQNGGIQGVTYCPQNICIFKGPKDFNVWLRNAIDISRGAFASIGLGSQMKIGYYGFDGFVTWGDNNPNWKGILEDATIAKMGNITIDHYPEVVGDSMQNDLNELEKKYPNVPIIIGEWGTISGGNIVQQVYNSMGAAVRKNIIGFNYWHLGMEGSESLINPDFSYKPTYYAVQSFFKGSAFNKVKP